MELADKISNSSALLAYFYNDTCAPCVALRPKVTELINTTFGKMDLEMVNASEFAELAASYHVFASPTIIAFFDGKETFRVSKYISIAELRDKIARYYDILFEDQ